MRVMRMMPESPITPSLCMVIRGARTNKSLQHNLLGMMAVAQLKDDSKYAAVYQLLHIFSVEKLEDYMAFHKVGSLSRVIHKLIMPLEIHLPSFKRQHVSSPLNFWRLVTVDPINLRRRSDCSRSRTTVIFSSSREF